MSNPLNYFDPASGRCVVPGPGRWDTYERPAAAHAAMERREFVARALRLVEATRDGPCLQDVEEALGCSPFARGLRVILTDGIPPHERHTLLDRLEQIERWQAGWDAQGDAEEATR
jgi:hypothetical protein